MIYSLINYFNSLFYEQNELEKVKCNLRKTVTLKKIFYTPNIIELKNKMFFIKHKNKYKINPTELLKIKDRLKPI